MNIIYANIKRSKYDTKNFRVTIIWYIIKCVLYNKICVKHVEISSKTERLLCCRIN